MSPRNSAEGRQSAAPRSRLRRRTTAAAVVSAALAATVLGAGTAQGADKPRGQAPSDDKGSLFNIAQVIGAHASYKAGYTGKGIGIALIDTGVTPVRGLDTGNVVDGPDLSFDSQDPELAHLDAHGHGTHLASIIAGRDVPGPARSYVSPDRFSGIAPDATLVDVKVGASDGAVDVSQVIAGIDWVVEHRNDPGLNIRVISLSYGTNSKQGSASDPLAYAVENAWRKGIVVVVAGGNDGRAERTLANPGSDPYVLSVGAVDTRATPRANDDTVPAWGTRGTNRRHVDAVAPGVSVLGLRVPNGYADERNPQARVGERFAKASGTSQAAAVVSGEVALLLQRYPALKPDQVKAQFVQTAMAFRESFIYRGAGTTNVAVAQAKPAGRAQQSVRAFGNGRGSLDAARGTSYVNNGVAPLRGEVDVFGRPWSGTAWAARTAAGTAWEGGRWMGVQLTGDDWQDGVWPTTGWATPDWTGRSWRTDEWSARTWREGSWTARTWREDSWSARTWRDQSWSARTWRSADLASAGWS